MRKLRRVLSLVFLMSLPAVGHAQVPATILLDAAEWIGNQLLGYAAGKVIDHVLGEDYEQKLRKVEANLSAQMRRSSQNSQQVQAELTATRRQLEILKSLLRSRPTPEELRTFKQQLAADLDRIVKTQERQGHRLDKAEQDIQNLSERLRTLELERSREPVPAGDTAVEIPQPRRVETESVTVDVPADVPWFHTGVHVHRKDLLDLVASGVVSTISDSGSPSTGPRGNSYSCNTECVFPPGRFGELVGRVGLSGEVFPVDSRRTFRTDTEGELFLAVNDCCNWDDNSGSFQVYISVEHRDIR